MREIRVLLADDHVLFRDSVAALLTADHGFELAGSAGDGVQALQMARELMPDVALMDVSMPLMDGLEATRRLRAELPYLPVIILTVSDCESTVLEAVRSGARGYLLKSVDPNAVRAALRGAVSGDASLSTAMAARLVAELSRDPDPTAAAQLTPREREVLARLARGERESESAAALGVDGGAVRNLVRNALEKLRLEGLVRAGDGSC